MHSIDEKYWKVIPFGKIIVFNSVQEEAHTQEPLEENIIDLGDLDSDDDPDDASIIDNDDSSNTNDEYPDGKKDDPEYDDQSQVGAEGITSK